jgi:D-threo-aldose 1-dehydrogenase
MKLGPTELRPLGRTGLLVTPICIGTSPLASMPSVYGYEVGATRAEATIAALLESGLNFIDTSNNYGSGSAETRIGNVVRQRGGLPDGIVLATKVDADSSGDFSGERVRRSVEESLDRLGIDRVRLMYLHDPEHHLTFEEAMAASGPVAALLSLHDEGVLDHLGVAGGPIQLMRDFIATGAFEVVLSHNRFTLLDRSAEPLMQDAGERGIAYVNAAPYGGGMLAKGPDMQPRYAYRETAEAVRDAARAIQQVCARYEIPLQAAALQFSLRSPLVASTVVGVSEPARIAETIALASLDIEDELWAELDLLVTPRELWLSD